MAIRHIGLVGICSVFSSLAFGGMYKWVDEHGIAQYSDHPPAHSTGGRVATDQVVSPLGASTAAPREFVRKPYPQGLKLELRQLLKQGRYAELDQRVRQFESAATADIADEERLFVAYKTFDIGDESFETPLTAWIAVNSHQPQPYLARAYHYYRRGWDARGGKWASETKQSQMDAMKAFFAKAQKDVASAQQIDNKSMVGYCILIGIAKAIGDEGDAKRLLEEALRRQPASYQVRVEYLMALTPRWGGSFEAMQSFIEWSQKDSSINPKLKLLQGVIYGDVASLAHLSKKYSRAEEIYTKGLEFGDNSTLFYGRSKSRFKLDRYEEALADASRALALKPENTDYLVWRSKVYAAMDRLAESAGDLEAAVLLDVTDDSLVSHRDWLARKLERKGYELTEERKSEEAVSMYNLALRMNPDNAALYTRRARSFVDLKQNDKALADLQRSIELDPNALGSFQLIDWILAQRRDWNQIVEYWGKYIALHPEDDRAYVERGGAYYRSGNVRAAVDDAKKAADMGNAQGQEAYEKFRHLAD